MTENLPTNVQLDNANGTVTFATDVVATIAGLAATEVEGVASMAGGASGLADILTRRNQATRSLTRGVRVDINENLVNVHVTIVVDFGSPVPEVTQSIQENVKKAIETMSGLHVVSVDVHVQGVSFERENRTAIELEMQQRLLLQRQEENASSQDGEGVENAGPAATATAGEPADDDDFGWEEDEKLADEPQEIGPQPGATGATDAAGAADAIGATDAIGAADAATGKAADETFGASDSLETDDVDEEEGAEEHEDTDH